MILRDVEVAGRPGLDVRLAQGRITEIGRGLRGGRDFDGGGGALIPGLADHHIHLLGLAAQGQSVDIAGAGDRKAFAALVEAALATRPDGTWLRVVGYHERIAGELTRDALDRLAPRHRLRVQHQAGSLWILNGPALESIGAQSGPEGVERDGSGRPTGRIWRADAWLRTRIDAQPPSLAEVGRRLAAYGITALTDASVTTGLSGAGLLAEAVRTGGLPQRLTLMSGGPLEPPADAAFAVGPVKVLLDDHSLPDLEDFIARIGQARRWGRPVAVHCVTAGELAISLAAFAAAGARAGDRIEHGGVIPPGALEPLKALGLTVVTQSAFVYERGERYAAELQGDELSDLYRCASLKAAGVPVAGSSDAPYASPDPWLGIRAAVARRSREGRPLGLGERLSPSEALGLYLGEPTDPGGAPRKVEVGAPADLCLLDASLVHALSDPDAARVRATFLGGEPSYIR